VLLATQAVLESRISLPEAPDVAPRRTAGRTEVEITIDSKLQDALKIINEGPERIFWQCGAVEADERDLILDIAHRAGIALGDSLSAPGFLPAYQQGRRVRNYLGMLGQYGTNQEVFEYLHSNGKLNRREEQCLFVLKGKLGQIDSPFSDAEHARRLHIVQINKNPAHLGPFADIGLAMPLFQFLQALRSNLSVKPDVLAGREKALAAVPRWIGDVSGAIPALPMTPNYFFAMLRSAVEKLITRHGYRYVGMFDVGHAGTLAVRYLPRTGPCHSGWYGRGLMGDPLQATGALVTNRGDPVIAVVGDGAKQLCPDILPSIVENLQATRAPIGKNVSIFYLVNNSLSIINSYQQRLMFKPGGRQMTVTNLEAFAEPDACADVHGNRIVRKRLVQVSEEELVDELLAMNRINLFSVPALSNDDWISIIDIGNWQCMRE
jgi:thiamine pyrophosphate-dependent acetolactate synthase large subunit-like protein